MSKNFGNYPDPKEMLEKYGGDALRLYLMSTPVMHGEDVAISETEYREQVKGLLLLYWNSYSYFVTYANICGFDPTKGVESTHVLDRYILSRLNQTIINVEKAFKSYDTPEAYNHLFQFIRDLSQWYIRRSRERFSVHEKGTDDQACAFSTLHFVLTTFSQVLAPLAPFVTEEVYRNLKGEESIHLTNWPKSGNVDIDLIEMMGRVRELSSKVHSFRKEHGLKVRTPLLRLEYKGPFELRDEQLRAVLHEEVNVYELVYKGKSDEYEVSGERGEKNVDAKRGMARDLVRKVQGMRKEKGLTIDEHITLVLPSEHESLGEENIEYIKKKTLAKKLTWGSSISIST